MGRRTGRRWTVAAALLVTITTGAGASASGLPGGVPALGNERPRCSAPDERDGGDWPGLNHDLRNTRQQPDEDRIGTASVAALEPAWSFDSASIEGVEHAGMRSTPVVAHGCVYIGLGLGYLGDEGHVIALDIDDGTVVWHRSIGASVLGLTVANGLVYATPSLGTRGEVRMPVVTADYTPEGSHAIAFDAHNGETRWTSERLDDGNAANGTFVNASPVAFEAGGRSLLFVPLAGGAGDGAKVPMYFLDALTGATVKKAYTLTDEEYGIDGYGGTGIWSTAAYDEATQHLFVGTADSDGHTKQHPYNNAILRIDANPSRSTFAKVVGSYKGTSEHADQDEYIGGEANPLCGIDADGEELDPPTFFDTSASPTCLELDLDFGGSPNLFEDSDDGSLRVGALQKSGIYHSVRASEMEVDWTFTVGPGGAFMDGATAAVDGERVLVGATPNLLFGLGRDAGDLHWASTTDADAFAYQPLTVANGVLYAINDTGFLLGFDAETGVPLLRRTIAADGDFTQCLGAGAGVAVARHTVFAPCDAGGPSDLAGVESTPGGLVAYRLPG